MTGRAWRWMRWGLVAAMTAATAGMLVAGAAAQASPSLYSGLKWRNIGPFHGGRVAAVTGVIGRPGTFYAGLPQGGIWETTSAGMTWFPIFDQVHAVDSIGAIAVAPSDPNVIYAGSGDAVQHEGHEGEGGDGMYKSTDGGKTWTHIGLEGTYKIPSIVVDPKNPNIVLVAALSGIYGTQRGVFRSDDGGQTWTNVLAPDAVTGARDLASPYDEPNVVFATMIADGVDSPPEGRGARGPARTQHTELYKSLDEGKTWTQVDSYPLHSGRTSVTVAMNTNGQRVYVIGSGGLYRSDDQGATWRRMAANDSRITGSAYICGVWVDSENPDLIYVMNTAAYRSTDGGETFHAFKGAPGGEDMHEVWIDPTNGQRMIYGDDQGAAVSLDGGHTWSSYYALPVAQLYHVSTDNRYPYWVLASQQDTAAIMIQDRGNGGNVSELDWRPLASS
ncbi:MAG: WD40/YVTN/BNR-like repeat-containing protein, partial [Terriglobales bacterium]